MASATIYANYAKSGLSSYNGNYVNLGQGTSGYRAVLGFDLSFLQNATISYFKLYLTSTTSSDSNLTQAVTFYASDDNSWEATHDASTVITSTKLSGSTRVYVWDFSSKASFLAALKALGSGAFLHLVETGNTRQMQYDGVSTGSTSTRPRLEIGYTLNRSTFTLDKTTVDAGSNIGMTITPADASYTHEVEWSFGSYSSSESLSAGTTAASLTVPMTWLNAIPNAVSGAASVTLRTLQDGVEIGSMTTSFTISAPASVMPSVSSFTAARVDGDVPSGWGVYVQGKSKATLTVTGAAGAYGSSIASYSISGGGYSSTGSSFTTGFLMSSGTITFTAIITDTRGRSVTVTVSITVYAYTNPTISSVSLVRCTSGGTVSVTGTYLKALVTFSCSPVNGNNSVTCTAQYRQGTSGTWSSAVSLTSGVSSVIGGGNISAEYAYQVLLSVTDAIQTVTRTEDITSAVYSIFVRAGGKGVSFGTADTVENGVKINPDWDFYAGGMNLAALTAGMLGIYLKTYTSVTQLGFTSGAATLDGCLNAMTPNSMLICGAVEFASGETPSVYGVVEIVRGLWTNRSYAIFWGKQVSHHTYRKYLTSDGDAFTDWYLMFDSSAVIPAASIGTDMRQGNTGNLTTTGSTWIAFSSAMAGVPFVHADQNSGTLTGHKITGVTASGFNIQPGTTDVSFNYTAIYRYP